MKKNGHRIIKVNPDSIAWEMGVEPGMYLVSVNGVDIEDVFDYQYLMDEEEIDVLIREENGEETLLEIEKDPDEDFTEAAAITAFSALSTRCRPVCVRPFILRTMTRGSVFYREIM